MRKSAKKVFTAYDERCFLRKVENNPKLSVTKLAAEIENRMYKKVNPETVRRVLRKNDFHKIGAKIPLLVTRIKRFEWNSQKTIYRRVRNSGKQFYSLMTTNIMYLDELDLIMYGE